MLPVWCRNCQTWLLSYASLRWRLLTTATIVIMLSKQNLILKGINPETNLKVFILRMALSTWILTEAILRDFVTAFLLKRFPWLNAGMLRVHFRPSNRWRMLKPRSAMTSSFSFNSSSNPLFSVMCISLIHPEYTFEIRVIAPDGIIPTSSFTVLACL